MNTLSQQQVDQFQEQGYLTGIEVFSESEVED